MFGQMTSQFRNLPSVDRIVGDERLRQFEKIYSHDLIVQVARQRLDRERSSIALGKQARTADDIVESVRAMLLGMEKPGLRPLVNATGVILHTNLGRAPLSVEAMQAMDEVSRGFSNVEFEVESGKRGSRQSYIEPLVCQLTGAEAAMVVNNNAAAVLLGLAALAKRKEVIVSRGQAVEIGDSFRIPDVMRQSGVKLIEVGTTNCTYVSDYEQAITDSTAGLMRVHSSNFQVVGFTHSTTIQELGSLSEKHGLALLDDLGSGCLLDTSVFGLSPEPMVQESIAAGTALAFFSGDKLLGGPQAGIIAGRKNYVDKLRRHPLARAVRIDKVRLAGLAATLIHYLKGEALRKIPIWVMISMPVDEIGRRAKTWAEAAGSPARVMEGESMVGGGSLPGGTLPTRLVVVPAGSKKRESMAQTLAQRLRNNRIPVIARISEDALILDPRSVFPEEDVIVIEALKTLNDPGMGV
jgi:L-seryl-tRNA(Ser) seleniumtransferase